MKCFTIVKVGYSAGIYGCSGEYFHLNYQDGEKLGQIAFSGMYGPEFRVAEIMRAKGYKPYYSRSDYGEMKLKDTRGRFLSETKAIEQIKAEL